MKIIISGGGTGGHIYPAIAIADALRKQDSSTNILFVGATGRMEMQHVPAAGYPIIGLRIRGFQQKKIYKNLLLPFKLLASLWTSRKILKDFQPDVVVGTGGYASAPILYMATMRKIPTLIQEQNAVLGLTNQLLAKHVDKVCVAYKDLKGHFPAEKVILTGNPVRAELLELAEKRQAAYDHFGLTSGKKCLLVLGGSLGAKTINESILRATDQLVEAGTQIVWAAGRLYFKDIQAQLTAQQRPHVKVYPLIKSMDLAYAAADVVVSRAGAGTIAELCIAQKAVIFVPSSNVAADHQTQNVLPLVASKAAWIVKDNEAKETLPRVAMKLLKLEHQQHTLSQNIKKWAMPDATTTITRLITELADLKKN